MSAFALSIGIRAVIDQRPFLMRLRRVYCLFLFVLVLELLRCKEFWLLAGLPLPLHPIRESLSLTGCLVVFFALYLYSEGYYVFGVRRESLHEGVLDAIRSSQLSVTSHHLDDVWQIRVPSGDAFLHAKAVKWLFNTGEISISPRTCGDLLQEIVDKMNNHFRMRPSRETVLGGAFWIGVGLFFAFHAARLMIGA